MSILNSIIEKGISNLNQDYNGFNIRDVIEKLILNADIDLENIWSPSYDVIKRKGKIIVYVELPGVKNDDVKLKFKNNTIKIIGFKKNHYKNDDTMINKGILSGKFSKKIKLPININNKENIKLKMENGVLKIIIYHEDNKQFTIKM